MALVNERFQVKSFPTALTKDLLFYEVHDSNLPKNKQPEYGSPHPNHQEYPDHVLTFVKASDENGKQEWYYAAKREAQDIYNWEFSEADIGGTKFPSVKRTYVFLREEFESEEPKQGSLMPNLPEDLFSGVYVLASKAQSRTEKEIDSVFVIEERTYVKKSILSEVRYDEKTGRGDIDTTELFYADEIVVGTTNAATLFSDETNAYWGLQSDGSFRSGQQLTANWFQIVSQSVIPANSTISSSNPAKTRVISRVTPLGTDVLFVETGALPSPAPAYGSAHYDSASWPNHKLILIKPADSSGLLYEFFYAADRPNQDLYNWEFSKASIGGQLFDSVKRTYFTLRSSFSPTTPATGSAMPNVPTNLFSGVYVLSDREQVRVNEPELDSLYVSEVLVYILKTTQTQLDFDEQFGGNLTSIQTLYFATEVVTGATTAKALFDTPSNAYWGLQSSGVMREGRQLSANWYAITERQVVPTNLAVGGRSYTTTVDFSWPADLASIEVDIWNRKDGGYENYVRPIYSKDAYSGPCKASVTESFHVTAPTPSSPTVLKPLPINISNPLFSVSIGATLHVASTLTVSTGTDHPVYVYTAGNYPIAATVPTSRPSSLVASDTVQPFRGGFLRKQITIFEP